jgi:hypothetical protein
MRVKQKTGYPSAGGGTSCRRSSPWTTSTSRRFVMAALAYGTPTSIWSVLVYGEQYVSGL